MEYRKIRAMNTHQLVLVMKLLAIASLSSPLICLIATESCRSRARHNNVS